MDIYITIQKYNYGDWNFLIGHQTLSHLTWWAEFYHNVNSEDLKWWFTSENSSKPYRFTSGNSVMEISKITLEIEDDK